MDLVQDHRVPIRQYRSKNELIYKMKDFNEPIDGIVYGVTVSLGFATLENIYYVYYIFLIYYIYYIYLFIYFIFIILYLF